MKRAGYIAAGVVAALVVAGCLALTFGTPEAPAPDPESPFAFQVPGCRCHSDDPAVVEAHASYRLNQCSGCHAGSP